MDRPEWWDWELAYTEHVEARMLERGVSEVELRTMFEDASSFEQATRPGRYTVHARLAGRPWTIVLEPEPDERRLYVVTVHPKDSP